MRIFFAYLRSAYMWTIGVLSFGLFAILGSLSTYVLAEKRSSILIRTMMRSIFWFLRMPVQVEGYDKLEKSKAYLYMPNHVSFLDAPLAAGFFPTAVRGVEAHLHFNWPIYGWLAKRYGNIPIDRNNLRQSINAMREATERVKQGQSMVIFPEGHRTLDGELREFKKLPFKIVKQAGIDVVPIGMSGLFLFNKKGEFLAQPVQLKLKVGTVLTAQEIAGMTEEQFMNEVRRQVLSLIEYP